MPKISFFLLASLLVLASCKQEQTTDPNNGNNTELLELENKVKQLELDNALKDSVINESLAFFNEIQSNLEEIGIKKDEIRALSNNPELENNDKEWILEQIRHINFLREDNARKVKQLNGQLEKNKLQIKELEVMIASLRKDIEWKDEQINLLQAELDRVDSEYSKLFDAYQEQAIKIDALQDDLNTVHYAYGSEDELIENGVIEKKNGFIGIGKKISLKDSFNDQYFTKADAKKTKSITIVGTDIRFITSHPTNSYSIQEQGAKSIITIKDASEFWKVSKYLVVTVG